MRIFMTGEDGHHNMGDEAQALASAKRLRHYFPKAEIVATGFDPVGAVLRHQARIVPWPLTPYDLDSSRINKVIRHIARRFGVSEDWLNPLSRDMAVIFEEQYRCSAQFRSVLEEIEKSDFIFDMGHGGLNDVFDPLMLCFLYYLAGRLNKPLFISGQGIGPLWRNRSIRMMRETLPYAHTVGLRDKDVSRRELIDTVGIDPQRVRLSEIGDDTLDLAPQEPAWDRFAPKVTDVLRSGNFFAVQWRPSDYTQSLRTTEQIVPLIEAIKCLCEITKLPAVFLPFSWETSASDVIVAARIHDYLQGQVPFYVAWNYLEAAELKWLLGHARFGIGLSYHFHVFLLSQGRPSIGPYTNAYYDIKLRGAFRAYGYEASPLRYSANLTTEPAFKATVDIVTQWTDTDCQALQSATDGLRNEWHSAFQTFVRDSGLTA